MWQHAHAPLHECLTHLMPCVHMPVPWLHAYAQAIIAMMALPWLHATPLGVHTCWSHTNPYTVWPCKVAMSFGLRQCPCESAREGAPWKINRHTPIAVAPTQGLKMKNALSLLLCQWSLLVLC